MKRNQFATEQQIRDILFQEMSAATTRSSAATRHFDEVMGQFPSGLPHSDGIQRIKKASTELTIARNELAKAHNRLNDYLSRGIVPEDLDRATKAAEMIASQAIKKGVRFPSEEQES